MRNAYLAPSKDCICPSEPVRMRSPMLEPRRQPRTYRSSVVIECSSPDAKPRIRSGIGHANVHNISTRPREGAKAPYYVRSFRHPNLLEKTHVACRRIAGVPNPATRNSPQVCSRPTSCWCYRPLQFPREFLLVWIRAWLARSKAPHVCHRKWNPNPRKKSKNKHL